MSIIQEEVHVMADWKGYVIRKTCEEGTHKGESFIYIKSGYVRLDSKNTFIFQDECYLNERTAKSCITRYKKRDDLDIRLGRLFNIKSSYEVVEVVNGHLV